MVINQPLMAHGMGGQAVDDRRNVGGNGWPIRNRGFLPTLPQVPRSNPLLIGITFRGQKALDPSLHNKRPWPTCGPTHCGPPRHWSFASSAGNRPAVPNEAGEHSLRPPRRPRTNNDSHSLYSPISSTSHYSSTGSEPSDNTKHNPPPLQSG
jgi:hypothetical protein